MIIIDQMEIRYHEEEGVGEIFENREIFQFDSMLPYVEEGWEFVPLPSIRGERSVSPVHMSYNVINPNSRQRKLAMEYMSLLAEMPLYCGEDSADQFPLLADIFHNRSRCIYGNYADYGDALSEYVRGTISEDEAVERITEYTERRLLQ